MEGKVNLLEGRFHAMEAMMEKLCGKMRGMTQDLGRALGRRGGNQGRSSEGSHDSVNGGRERCEEESDDKIKGKCGDVQRSWMKRVELPTFESNDPTGWNGRAEKFFEL